LNSVGKIKTGERMSEKEKYELDGYVGPIDLIKEDEVRSCYKSFFESIGQDSNCPGPAGGNMGGYFTRYDWAYRLATHPDVLERMAQFLGEDVLLWAMHFWYKSPKHPTWIPWHQDNSYWPMEPSINASAWITLGETFPENGCLQVIPGSHRKAIPHDHQPGEGASFGRGISSDVVESLGGPHVLTMRPGQGVFFNESLIHGSEPNISDVPRVAFSLRYTTPEVVFDESKFNDAWKENLRTVLVRGKDRFGHNLGMRWTAPSEWERETEATLA